MIAYITSELYHVPEASSTTPREAAGVDPAAVRLVILAAGSSTRMGWNKLAAPLAGIPLIRRVAGGLAVLGPLVVAAPEAAAALDGLPDVTVLVTDPTAGPGATLALANAALPPGPIAVVAADLPFLDETLVWAFIARVPAEADLAYPVVAGTPGHPVVWSAGARARIAGLGGAAGNSLRSDPTLRVVALEETDDAYVSDVDTPAAWAAAETRLIRPSRT
jgi:molybdenum cofactor cytidylyltransferase